MEDEQELMAKFLGAPAWGKAAGKEEGNVSNPVMTTLLLDEDQEPGEVANEERPGPSPIQPKKFPAVVTQD